MHKQPLLDVDTRRRDPKFGKDIQPESGPPQARFGDYDETDKMSDFSSPDMRKQWTYIEKRNNECLNLKMSGQLCSNLEEPEFCLSSYIPSLDIEYKFLSQNDIVQKPQSIYLKNCERFGKQNMHHEIIEMNKYKFKGEDKLLLPQQFHVNLDITEIDDLTYTKNIKVFTEILFHKNKQILVVKSWQKILYQNLNAQFVKNRSKSQTSMVVPKARQGMLHGEDSDQVSDNSALIELPEGFDNTRCFYVKTIQLYDEMGKKLCDPILTEHVQGQFEEHKLYEVSITQFKNKIFYFKKVYSTGSSLIDYGLMGGEVEKDQLQLYSFDLDKCTESKVNGFTIQEDQPSNTIFSKEFGPPSDEPKPEDEKSFLRSQYIVMQEYIKSNEYKQLFIVQFAENGLKEITKTIKKDAFFQDSDTNRQVQLAHHIKTSKSQTYFIIQNMFVTVQISYDSKDSQNESIELFERNSLDVFQKIWNTCFLKIQSVTLKVYNDHNHLEVFDQYFFIDSKNKVQLIYPNYKKKIDRTQRTDMILDQINVEVINHQEMKKINIASQVPSNQNVVQKIEDLAKILNHEQIQQSCQFVFCKDKNNKKQNLYMSSPKSKTISIWWLKQHNCVECKQFEDIDNELMRAQQSQAILENQNQNSVMTIMKQVQCTLGKRIVTANQRYNKGRNEDEKGNMCGICDDDHQEEYISYMVSMQDIKEEQYQQEDVDIDVQQQMVKIREKERENHVFLDDPISGVKKKVKTFDPLDGDTENTKLRLILYQPTQNYECFVFSIFNQDKRDEDDESNDYKTVVKKSYFFITKTSQQMRQIIKSKGQVPIISNDDEIYLLKSHRCITKMNLLDIRDYQFEQVDCISYDSAKFYNSNKQDHYTEVKLTFIQVKDIRRNVNFIPFIYQDRTLENNNFLIYDISENQMSKPVCVNPPKKSMKYIYEDEQGFNCFSLCRTSDINEEESKGRKKKHADQKRQTAKYQLFLLFSEKVGIIQTNEFLITNDNGQSVLQPIGRKMIMLSKKSQQMYDWSLLKNFKTIPFKDTCESTKGCQLIIQTSKVNYTYINLLDQDQNNLYNYKSQIVLVGNKMFQIQSDDQDIYAMVISAVLRKKIITTKAFNTYEIDKILNKAIEISFGMKIPDLSYLILNRFEDLLGQSFFQAQELLQCKSICEISLGDSELINEGIKNYREGEESHLIGSIFDVLTKGDQVRKDTFREMGIAPKILIIQKDLNFICTIERALVHKQFKSAKIILNHVHRVINSFDYQPLIMQDLPVILDSRQVKINEFFKISESDRKDREKEGFCNIEINFKDPEVPVFSDHSKEYIIHDVFEDHHQFEVELIKKIVKRDELKLPGTVKNFVVGHTYIDFRDVILGEKLRAIQKDQEMKIKFNNRYYADWMQKCGEANQEFYLQESVQKLIDYQWTTTHVIMSNLTLMYVLLFLLPIAITLFTENENIHASMLKLAIPPAMILTVIELIQLGNQGINYFYGWNLVDFSLLVVFSVLQYYGSIKQDHSMVYMPETKMLLILLAFLKLLFFVRIFEEYGFLVQMIRLCVLDLIPFILSYMIFLMLFTVCFVVLKMEIDPEVAEVENLSYFQMMFLQTFRTAIGELGMPQYGNILEKEDSFFKMFNVSLIWILWFFQTFFMLIIMLNFLIAVITSTYERVMNYQKIISYMHKAELNVEVFQLISFFYTLEEYRFIIFSTSKQSASLEDDQFSEIIDLLKKFIFQENKELKQSHDEITKSMNQVADMQENLGDRIKRRFQDLAEKQNNIREDLIAQLRNKQ